MQLHNHRPSTAYNPPAQGLARQHAAQQPAAQHEANGQEKETPPPALSNESAGVLGCGGAPINAAAAPETPMEITLRRRSSERKGDPTAGQSPLRPLRRRARSGGGIRQGIRWAAAVPALTGCPLLTADC